MKDAEMDAAAKAIVRRAMADLRALDPDCDCILLHATQLMLAFALDERVIHEDDAGEAIDLVRYLELAQEHRRVRYGLDRVTVDGPLHPQAQQEGPLVSRVEVLLHGHPRPVSAVVEHLEGLLEGDGDEEGGGTA